MGENLCSCCISFSHFCGPNQLCVYTSSRLWCEMTHFEFSGSSDSFFQTCTFGASNLVEDSYNLLSLIFRPYAIQIGFLWTNIFSGVSSHVLLLWNQNSTRLASIWSKSLLSEPGATSLCTCFFPFNSSVTYRQCLRSTASPTFNIIFANIHFQSSWLHFPN